MSDRASSNGSSKSSSKTQTKAKRKRCPKEHAVIKTAIVFL